jgi:hypothetical protein
MRVVVLLSENMKIALFLEGTMKFDGSLRRLQRNMLPPYTGLKMEAIILRNVDNRLPHFTMSHPGRRLSSSYPFQLLP